MSAVAAVPFAISLPVAATSVTVTPASYHVGEYGSNVGPGTVEAAAARVPTALTGSLTAQNKPAVNKATCD